MLRLPPYRFGNPAAMGGFSLSRYLATVDGSVWGYTRSANLSQDTAGSTPIINFGEKIGRVVDTVNARHAVQASDSLKPAWQATGAKFDGADDYHMTSYLAGATINFMAVLMTVSASIPSVQIVGGSRSTSDTRFGLAVGTDGKAASLIGSTSTLVAAGADLRGTRAVVGVAINGTTVRLYTGGGIHDSAQSGSVQTTVPIALGGFNSNSTILFPFSGSIERFAAGKDFPSLSRFNQIASALLAA